MSYMDGGAAFAGGIQELSFDEIELVDGASHRYAEAFLVGAAAGAFIGGFGGPEGAAAGALIGGLIGVGIIAIP